MLNIIKKRFALSNKGAKDFLKGVVFTTLLDLALMLPAIFVFLFFDDYLKPYIDGIDSSHSGFLYYACLGLAFMIIMWIIARIQYRSTYTTVYDESANRRIALAEKLRKLPLAFFGQKNLSDLTSTIMADSTELEHTFSHAVPQLFSSMISLLLIMIGLFFFNWQMSLALFWVVPVATIVLLLAKKKIDNDNRIHYKTQRAVTERIQEGLDTVQEVKAYNQENDYLDKLENDLNKYEKHLISGELFTGTIVNTSHSILKLGLASVIIVGASLIAVGSLNLFTYFIFLFISASIYNPIGLVFNNTAALFYLDIRINRMNEMNSLQSQQGNSEYKLDSYDVVFDNVDFSYEPGKKILAGVSFTAKQGEITALVGPSGGGKSTSAKLAARFWDIDSGQITLGNQDIGKIDPEELLKNYSVVFQDVLLFNSSIKENLRIGNRDASDDEIIKAAKLAQCHEFISKMPEGYNTVIGENGETLSGGERQRISIARALLKNAPIILLDEATASLDVENETKIQAGISELIKNKTVLIIAHRMRTVANADKIVVLENGKVVESGTPDQLRNEGGIFAKMVERQFGLLN